MKKISTALVVLMLSAFMSACQLFKAPPEPEVQPMEGLALSPLPGGHVFPGVKLPDRISPSHYELELDVFPEKGIIEGRVSIDIEIKQTLQSIWMHGWDLDVSQSNLVLADGRILPAEYQSLGPWGEVVLSLPEPVGAGTAQLQFVYSAKLHDDLLGPYKVDLGDELYVYTQFQDSYARRCFPSFDEPSLKATFQMAITAAEGDIVVANSAEISSQAAQDGRIRHEFATTPAISPYLLAFAVGPFDVVEAEPIPPSAVRSYEIPLRALAAKGRGADLAEALSYAAPLLTNLESYFALPYPYGKLDLLAVIDFDAGAMENPGLVTFREPLLLLDANASLSQKKDVAVVMAHELAHQWFGNLVTMAWWDDIWLNESFAEWMGFKVVHQWKPEMMADLSMSRAVYRVMSSDSTVSAVPMRRPIRTYHDIVSAFDGIAYEKGSGVLRMYERYLGEDVFREGVRLYIRERQGGTADMNDLLAALSQVATTDISLPFQTFVRQAGVPFLDVALQCQDEESVLTVNQSRYLPLGLDEAQLQGQWQVPFCVKYGVGGEEDEQCTLLSEATSEVHLAAKTCPDWVFPNAAGAGYYRWSLDAKGWDDLSEKAYGHLGPIERLSYADSLEAAFHRGDLNFSQAAQLMLPLAKDASLNTINAPINLLISAHDTLVDEELRPAVALEIRRVFAPVLQALPPPGQGDYQEELLRSNLEEMVAEVGMDSILRQQLVEEASAFVGFKGDGILHLELADPDSIGSALIVAVQDLGKPFYDHLRGLLDITQDGQSRSWLIQGLAGTRDAASREELLGLLTDGTLRQNEWSRVFMVHMSYVENRLPLWTWIQSNLDLLVEKTPAFQLGFLPWVGAGFCDVAMADELAEVIGPVVEETPRGKHNLEKVSELIYLCSAFKEVHAAGAEDYFLSLSGQ